MRPPDFSSEVLRQFLLGTLAGADHAQIEARQKTDDQLVDAIELAESELTDAYLDGELSDNEQTRYLNVFLTTPNRRAHLDLAKGVRSIAAEDSRLSRLKVIAILATICVLAAIIAYQQATAVQIVLLEPNTRSSTSQPNISLSRARSTIVLELQCSSIPPSHTAKFGRIGESDPLLTIQIEKPTSPVIKLSLQRSQLTPGDYLAILSDGEAFRADFRLIVAP